MVFNNKKEQFIWRLFKLTEENELDWEAIGPSKYEDLIYNPNKTVSLFRTELKGKTILLLEKKIPHYHNEFDEYYDQANIEVLVLSDENFVALTIDDDSASIDALAKLIYLVTEKVSKVDEFLTEILEMDNED